MSIYYLSFLGKSWESSELISAKTNNKMIRICSYSEYLNLSKYWVPTFYLFYAVRLSSNGQIFHDHAPNFRSHRMFFSPRTTESEEIRRKPKVPGRKFPFFGKFRPEVVSNGWSSDLKTEAISDNLIIRTNKTAYTYLPTWLKK